MKTCGVGSGLHIEYGRINIFKGFTSLGVVMTVDTKHDKEGYERKKNYTTTILCIVK